MKRCPYCSEWIQDEAIRCRYCHGDLTAAERAPLSSQVPERPSSQRLPSAGGAGPAASAPAPSAGEGAVRFSHSGFRYVLGFGEDFFGIWSRERPGQPVERYPRTDEGWGEAWKRFHAMEPEAVDVPQPPTPAAGTTTAGAPVADADALPPATAPPGTTPAESVPPETPAAKTPPAEAAPAEARIGEGAIRFSHSGTRYILGYGQDFFGIWDREAPGGPVMRFPRNDEGWGAAWNRFTAWEPKAVEVPITGAAPDVRVSTGEFRSAQTRAKWTVWLLGIIAVLSVLQFSFRLMELNLLQRRERGEVVTLAEAQASDARVTAMDIASFVVGIGAILAWLMWQHRSQANVRALGAGDLKFTPGWAVGWWFIPFANVVQPFRAMRELWKASDPDAGAVDWKGRPSTPLLPAWWTGWLLRLFVFPFLAFGAASGENPPIADLISRDRYLLAGDAVTVVTAVLALLLVRSITARLEAKQQRVTAWRGSFGQGG